MKKLLLALLALFPLLLAAQITPNLQLDIAASKSMVDVRDYGVKCDGSTDDSTAMNNALAAAVAVGTKTGTAHVKIPAGICVGNFSIVQGKGLKIEGSGELSTHLRSPNANPALQINGLWYSTFSDLTFDTTTHTTANAVVEIDGNWDNTHTQGIQFITFTNVQFAGTGVNDGIPSKYVVAVCRQGGSSCQGSNVVFINDELHGAGGAGTAVYYQNGYNALGNQFIGGDFQGYGGDGAQIVFGSAQFFGTTFESTEECTQLTNGGFDVHASQGGVFTAIGLYDIRTESYSFYSGAASQPIDAHGITHNPAFSRWVANTLYSVGTGIKRQDKNGKYHLYCVTTAGTTGATQPSPWLSTGTQADGSVVWTVTLYDFVNSTGGVFDYSTSYIDPTASMDTKMSASKPWILGITNPLSTGAQGAAQFIGDNANSEFGLTSQNSALDVIVSQTSGASRLKWPGLESLASLPASTVGIIDVAGYGFGLADNNYNHLSWFFHDIPCASGNCDEASFFAGFSQSANAIVQACPPYATSSICANPYWYIDGSGTDHTTGGNTFGSSSSQTAAACETTFGITKLSTYSTTTDTGQNCLPANAIIDAVVYRITTTITNIASFTIGDGTTARRFCGTQSTLTAGTTGTCFVQADQTGAAGPRQTSAAKVRWTGTGGTGSGIPGAGAIRLITYYHTWTPPTS